MPEKFKQTGKTYHLIKKYVDATKNKWKQSFFKSKISQRKTKNDKTNSNFLV